MKEENNEKQEMKIEDIFNDKNIEKVKNVILKREQLKKIGFKETLHFTITNSLTYDLGRDRFLSFGDIGTPNEMLFIVEKDDDERDIIILRNYDYDGYTTIEEVQQLITLLEWKKKRNYIGKG